MTVSETVHEHIDWLKIYVDGMTPDNWIDMRLRCERQLNELTAALSDQAGGWQDISTAPKDQEVEVRGIWKLRGDGIVFTHWRPCQTPPPSSTAGEG